MNSDSRRWQVNLWIASHVDDGCAHLQDPDRPAAHGVLRGRDAGLRARVALPARAAPAGQRRRRARPAARRARLHKGGVDPAAVSVLLYSTTWRMLLFQPGIFLVRYLEWSITEGSEVRRQDAASVIAGVLRSTVGYYVAKDFVYSRIQDIYTA